MNDQKCRDAFEGWIKTGHSVVFVQLPDYPYAMQIRKRLENATEPPLRLEEQMMAFMYFSIETLNAEKAALSQPKQEPVGELPAKLLTDVQWMNIVNHDRVWQNHTKEDAVHESVKMTEAKCIANAQTFANTRAREALERAAAFCDDIAKNGEAGWIAAQIRELMKEYE